MSLSSPLSPSSLDPFHSHQPLALAPPISPFLTPFDTPTTITTRLAHDLSPATSLKPSPTLSIFSTGDLESPSRTEQFVQKAYIASKTSADLIMVLDLPVLPEMNRGNPSDSGGENGPGDRQSGIVPPVPPTTPVTSRFNMIPSMSKDAGSLSSQYVKKSTDHASLRTSTRRPNRMPFNDRPFLRMSTTTASLSDFAPPLDIPLKSLSIASGDDEADKSSRRSSSGTFGRARRWSVSTSSVADATGSFRGAKQASETFLSDGEGDADDASMTSSQRRKRRRHQSLSSTTSTSVSGQNGPMASEIIAIHNSNGLFPSPTQPKKTHRKPESDAAITAHLLKTASRDPRKIVPALGGALSPPIQLHPPSSGTPLKSGLVDEETGIGSSDDGETPPRKRDPLKTRSKIEQLLGDGAVAAGAQMEYERQAWRDALQMPQKSPAGPVPPYRGHRATHSSPNAPVTPPSIFSEHHTPRHGHAPSDPIEMHFQPRSGSYESIPSLHPSISDSLTQLLPPRHPHSPTVLMANMKALPSTPRGPPRMSSIEDESQRGELSADEKRVQLQRRMRALEKRLGERLVDDGTGKLIIKPAEGATTIVAEVPDFWPPTPTSSTPDWARDDVVPRIVPVPKAVVEPNTLGKKQPRTLAKEMPGGDLKIYVGRQTQVAQFTGTASTPLNRQDSNTLTRTSTQMSGDVSKGQTYDPADEDAILASNRRRQLVKLQKLLGEVLTPAYLPPSRTSVGSRPETPLSHHPSRQTLKRIDSPHSDQTSFIDMSMDDLSHPMIKSDTPSKDGGILKSQWATKLKQSMSMSSGKSKRVIGDDESFVNFGSGRGGGTWGKSNPLNSGTTHNRVLSYDSPLSSRSSKPTPLSDSQWNTMESTPSRPSRAPAPQSTLGDSPYDNYKQSLQGLLYLAENNPSQLVRLVDSLEETADPTPRRPPRPDRDSHSPPSPILKSPTFSPDESYYGVIDPHSEEARRKRVGKLSKFFGEGLDFTSPSNPLHQSPRYDIDLASPTPSRQTFDRSSSGGRNKGKSRLEVLDGMLGDLWRGVQSELKGGGMKRDEVDRLGEMFGAYKRRRDKRRRENMTGWEEL